MASSKKYKIKISSERTLGPLDMARIEALVKKGLIQGQEPTSEEPFVEWQPFSSFPRFAEALLKKLESDQKQPTQEPQSETAITKTIVDPERTKTLVGEVEGQESDQVSFGIPTLIDIPIPPPDNNPDNERTIIDLRASSKLEEQETEGGTKILSLEKIETALEEFQEAPKAPILLTEVGEKKNIFGKTVDQSQYVTETGKKRLLSRNTAALLALGILMVTYWSTKSEEEADPSNINPRFHQFPYMEVNMPPKLGISIDRVASSELTDRGSKIIEKETPSSYYRAIKTAFYPAVGKDPTNHDARALLVSSYIRISEIIPRDKRLFETLEKLILPGPANPQWTPEYVVALAEYYQMLNRFDQAQEIIDQFLNRRQTPELYYQKARISFERKELDQALGAINKSIPPEKIQRANPRHLLYQAFLLDKKGQREAVLETIKRMTRESAKFGLHGPSLLFQADFLQRSGKNKEARVILKKLLDRPGLLDRMQLADAFTVAAKTLEGLNDLPRAKRFADTAEKIHYDKEIIQDILFRIRSKIPSSKQAYGLLVAGRQKEKAKQLDQAMNLYVRGLELNRRDPIPFLLIANLFEQRGEIEEAIDRFQKASKGTNYRPIDAHLNLARIYSQRFDFEKAQSNLKMAHDLRTKRDHVAYLRGLMNLKARKNQIGINLMEGAIKKGSRLTDLYIEMGDVEVEKKNQKLAEFYYSMALRYSPFHPKAMLGVALTRFHLDSPSRAISFLKDKLLTQPNSAAIMTNLAIIYLRSGDQDSGKNYLQNAIRSDAKYAEAFRLLGDLTKDEGNRQTENYAARRYSYRYALASYEMYSKLAPNDPEGYRATGDLYFDIRDLGAAAKNYHQVLALTPNYPDVRIRLARISRNGGDTEKAMQFLNEELKLNPRSDEAMVEKGNIFMTKKDLDSAIKSYTNAARINEKNADALYGLAMVYHFQQSYDNALSLFTRVKNLDPLKADVYWQMGLIYEKKSNYAKAISSFTDFKGVVRDPALIGQANQKIAQIEAQK